jgi:hypothetical protein
MNKIFSILYLVIFTTSIFAQTEKVNFNKKFKKEYDGKCIVEVNKTKELLIIMLAITDYGLGNDDMFEQRGDYYQRVLEQFKPFKNEPIIKKMDSLMNITPINYVFFIANSVSYNFNKKGKLIPDKYFIFPGNSLAGVKISENPIKTYKTEIEDFAKKTNFEQFFKNENDFYNSLTNDYKKYANIEGQWKWLDSNFNTKMNAYIVSISALIYGLNFNAGFEENNFKMAYLSLPPVEIKGNEIETTSINSRASFTEIDHNFVAFPSEKYEKEINSALKDREKWVNTKMEGTQYYPTALNVFNEYITFGVFVLYAEEMYKKDPKLVEYINNDVVNTMVNSRGFIKMKEFNEELKRLRKENMDKKIDNLYPELLKWCAGQ